MDRRRRHPRSKDPLDPEPGDPIRLVVQADDFGLCHAVNEGIVRAFVDGILTQATMMAPCPWFPEAVALAKAHAIPVGLHTTLTCEWPHMRWRPLTDAPSLVRDDGSFHETVVEARRHAKHDEALAELEAQASAMSDAGLDPLYFDAHMGLVSRSAIDALCRRHAKPFVLPFVPRFVWLHSFLVLSPVPHDRKRKTLVRYLEALPPGDHFLQVHPAIAAPELRALAEAGTALGEWGEPIRALDLALLVDPEIRAIVAGRGIQLTTVADYRTASPEAGRSLRPALTRDARETSDLGDAA